MPGTAKREKNNSSTKIVDKKQEDSSPTVAVAQTGSKSNIGETSNKTTTNNILTPYERMRPNGGVELTGAEFTLDSKAEFQ